MSLANVQVDGAPVGQARAMKLRVGAPGFTLHFAADAVTVWAPLAAGGKVLNSVTVTTSDAAGQPFVVYELKGAVVTSLDNRWISGGSPSVEVALAYSALRVSYKGAVLDLPANG